MKKSKIWKRMKWVYISVHKNWIIAHLFIVFSYFNLFQCFFSKDINGKLYFVYLSFSCEYLLFTISSIFVSTLFWSVYVTIFCNNWWKYFLFWAFEIFSITPTGFIREFGTYFKNHFGTIHFNNFQRMSRQSQIEH